ncbi:leucine-rich repeat-containing protein 9 isoform X2 [Halyomorpha halys]|uniref:leucine-rich repeat-containing protein 9 isoform X2 n=1 Tax=Halyomorpha halys TaxID=286706 RepID=UPI0034D1F375
MDFSSRSTTNLLYPSFEYIHSKIEEPIDLDSLNTNLKSLVIIGEPLYAVPDLTSFKDLEDLWLVECSLHKGDQVQYGRYLRNLHLSSNTLTKIPDVANLRHLKQLWLPGNLIERIYENELPPSLEDLNVAENRISTIENSFQNCCNLETLNISANPIQTIFELCHLTKLKRLKNLWLCDPLFEMTSLTRLVNFRAFVINCLPNLKRLDYYPIDEKETELSKLFFVNKHNHYKMLSMDTTYNYYLNHEEEYQNSSYELQKLKRNLYVLSLNEEKAKGKEDDHTLMLIQKLRKHLKYRINVWENRRLQAENELEEQRKLHIHQIEVELANFGNIKFKMHNKNSSVARTCEKVLNSFICNHLKNIIDSIEVISVTQVLRAGKCSLKFMPQNCELTPDQILESLYILCEPLYVQDSYEPFFNYVQQSLYFQVDEIKYTVSQCIGKADSSSFDQIYNINKDSDICQERILALVFMDVDNMKDASKESEVTDVIEKCLNSSNNCEIYNAAYKLVANPILLVEYKYITKDMLHLYYIDLSWNLFSSLGELLLWIRRSAPFTSKLNLKFNLFADINNNSHEEYLVFRLLGKLTTYNGSERKKPANIFKMEDLSGLPIKQAPLDPIIPNHLEVLKLNNQDVPFSDVQGPQLRLEIDEKSTCLYYLRDESLFDLDEKLSYKNIISCSITKRELETTLCLRNLRHLKEINLSRNLLESIERNILWNNNIVKLDLSCNYIKTLAVLADLQFPNLKFLDMSKNQLQDCFGIENATNIEELNVAFNNISELDRFLFLKRFRKLRFIDIRRNGIEQMDTLKRYLIYHVKSLEYINGVSISESDIAEAHNAVGGVLDNDYLESVNKNKDLKKMKHLNLVNASIKLISLTSINLENLVSVNLDNNTIESIAELLVLENLKYLSLAGNQISKFGEESGSRVFNKLEELHLNKNSIVNLEPLKLHKMPRLKTLYLQDNCITTLRGIEHLGSLRHLILDRNKITSINSNDVKRFINLKDLYLESNHLNKLDFLPSLKRIIRLFIKNNRIENIDTLRFLKHLTKIQEFTFSGNPVCRKFESYVKVLTYLPNINYVDGFLIESFTPIESQSLTSQ